MTAANRNNLRRLAESVWGCRSGGELLFLFLELNPIILTGYEEDSQSWVCSILGRMVVNLGFVDVLA
jgi:hypothetical protein